MKKLLSLITVVSIAASAAAGDFKTYSFLAPGFSALSITNKVGWTNLNNISQNVLQGLYQIGTNLAGTGINASIATNYNLTRFTNGTPLIVSGQVLPGTLIVNTNNTIANNTNAGYQLFLLTTNIQANPFVDVPVGADMNMSPPAFGPPGAASQLGTNVVGVITIKSVWDPYPNANAGGGAGVGSNIVNLVVGPVFEKSPDQGPNMEPTDAAFTGGYTWTISYTNQISAYAPTVYSYPVFQYQMGGARYLRVRSLSSGTSTNALWVMGITFSDWVP